MRTIRLGNYFVAIMILVSCTSTQTDRTTDVRASRLSVVVVFDKKMFIPNPAHFAWPPGGTHSYMDSKLKNVPVISMLKEIIQEQLVQKGFKHSASAKDADFLVMFTVAVEDALSDEAINENFGIQPGLQSDTSQNNKYTKGTLVIDIQNKFTRQSLLRGAIQGFTKFDLSNEERKMRLKAAVRNVLEKLPSLT